MQQQSAAAISAGGEQAEALAMGEMEARPERCMAQNGLVIDALSAAMLMGFQPSNVPQQRTSDAALPTHSKVQQLQKGSGEPGPLLVGHQAPVAGGGKSNLTSGAANRLQTLFSKARRLCLVLNPQKLIRFGKRGNF